MHKTTCFIDYMIHTINNYIMDPIFSDVVISFPMSRHLSTLKWYSCKLFPLTIWYIHYRPNNKSTVSFCSYKLLCHSFLSSALVPLLSLSSPHFHHPPLCRLLVILFYPLITKFTHFFLARGNSFFIQLRIMEVFLFIIMSR